MGCELVQRAIPTPGPGGTGCLVGERSWSGSRRKMMCEESLKPGPEQSQSAV